MDLLREIGKEVLVVVEQCDCRFYQEMAKAKKSHAYHGFDDYKSFFMTTYEDKT